MLIDERTTGQEIALIVGGPIVAGIIAGVFLGISEPLYLIFSLVMIAAGYATGMEHKGVVEGFYRGLIGGLLFGTFILLTNATLEKVPKADLPDPAQWLVVITTVFGCLLGALGGRARARTDARKAA